jgi:predicted nuclease of predicted toxin-antitoxin system
MKLKLDENLGTKAAELLREAGHDVSTVPEQNLYSTPDKELIALCRTQQRCLVTLDLDFANPLIFKPEDYFGIAVLRLPPKASPKDLYDTAKSLIGGLELEGIEGKLWIVEKGRIREYQPSEDR